jgi:hypothetical protein
MSAHKIYSETQISTVEVEETIRGKICYFDVKVEWVDSAWREVDEDGRGYSTSESSEPIATIMNEEDNPKLTEKQRDTILTKAIDNSY